MYNGSRHNIPTMRHGMRRCEHTKHRARHVIIHNFRVFGANSVHSRHRIISAFLIEGTSAIRLLLFHACRAQHFQSETVFYNVIVSSFVFLPCHRRRQVNVEPREREKKKSSEKGEKNTHKMRDKNRKKTCTIIIRGSNNARTHARTHNNSRKTASTATFWLRPK